jgi:hypothetical protein
MIRQAALVGATLAMGLAGSLGMGTLGATSVAASTSVPAFGCHQDCGGRDRGGRCDQRWGCDDRRHGDFCDRHRHDPDWDRRGSEWDRNCRGWW